MTSMIKTVIHFTDGKVFGGAEQIMLHTLAGLDQRQWRRVLFHHSELKIQPLLTRANALNINLRSVPRIQTMGDIIRFPEFIRTIRTEQPSIFHAHLSWPLSCKDGLLAAVMARVPVIIASVHNCEEFTKRQFLLRMQPRLIASAVDLYLPVSEAAAELLRNAYRIPPERIHVVRNGIPLAGFYRASPVAAADSYTPTTKRTTVLSTSRLSKEKGHEYLLMAAALVPQATFVLAGGGHGAGQA